MKFLPRARPLPHGMLVAAGIVAILVLGLVAVRLVSSSDRRTGVAVAAPVGAGPSAAPRPAASELVPPEPEESDSVATGEDLAGLTAAAEAASGAQEAGPSAPPPPAPRLTITGRPKAVPFQRVKLPGANERMRRESREERVRRQNSERTPGMRPAEDDPARSKPTRKDPGG